MPKPIVSVLIDTYNHERFIEQALLSVLEQDFPVTQTEIIVIDDGSTDATPEIVRKFAPRVRLLQKPNGGQASAFNAGIPESSGEFVAFLDGDDWWLPEKLTRVLEAFHKQPSLGFVGHGIVLTYLDGRQMTHVLDREPSFRVNTPEAARLFRLRKAFMGTSRMTVRAALLRQILPVPEALGVQADEYVFTLAAALGDLKILTEPLCHYRIHDANGFQVSTSDPQRIRNKQIVLAELARCLGSRLPGFGVNDQTTAIIVESIQADANQLRLMLDGGWPWETVKTEWSIYSMMFTDLPLSRRALKALSLLPALAIPPRAFYNLRQQFAQNSLYVRARKRWLPVPELSHVKTTWR